MSANALTVGSQFSYTATDDLDAVAEQLSMCVLFAREANWKQKTRNCSKLEGKMFFHTLRAREAKKNRNWSEKNTSVV